MGLSAPVVDPPHFFNLAVRPNALQNVWCEVACWVISSGIRKKLAIGEYRGILISLDAVVHF